MRLALRLVLILFLCASLFAQGNRPAPEPEGPNHDNPLARELWFRHGRVVPGKPGAAARLLRHAYQQKMKLRATRLQAMRGAGMSAYSASLATATASSTSGYGGWVPLGPAPLNSNASGSLGEQDYGPVTGRATSVVADPGDPTGNTVYLGGAYGGLWKSTNAAASSPSAVTWTPLIDQQATLAVGSVAVQPSSSGPSSVVLVGTGEADFSIDSYYGLGILRSADGGNTWTLISSANGAQFSGVAFAKIAFSTDNPNLVVAAATGSGNDEGASNFGNAPGLYTSADGGQTWTMALQGAFPGIGSTSVIYDSAGHKFFAFLQFEGYYTSTDGMSWHRLGSQPGSALQNCPTGNNGGPFCLVFRGEMTAVPGREELYTWYVTIDNQGNIGDGGIYKTTNGGGSWQQVSDSGITNCGDGNGNGCGVEQGWFNLELAAVPNGTGTDLYAGAVNIYKCSITAANSLCATRPFINLTHVYGCSPVGSLSHVHPDQHGISFVRPNPSQAVMYFANDGGIYRALNGYALSSGTCGTAPNPFQNLNATMGSMTQFVDFSNSPSDVNTVLGGTQDNGSPATSNDGSSWISVNGGDGGFNVIDPVSGMWFTSNTDVSVQSCPSGINCLEQTFTPIVTNSTVGGDHGFFYTPFILDPQADSRMMVGTCRLWRGNSNGSGFSALSYNFDSVMNQVLNAACTGGETQLIRSIAAGGPNTANGSSVIYVGTEGGFVSNGAGGSSPVGGHIWATNDADLGAFTWANQTAVGDGPDPISSIAVDRRDPSGNTAYATVMGFGTAHVFQTTDQGLTWYAEGFGLPNAPVDAVLIDPDDSNTFYVATDVGVYTSHDLQNWTELGQLPNVPVLQLKMFESGGGKQLRAGTYGRGIWSYDIPYQITITTPHVHLFPGQTGTMHGVITGYNGYNSPVAIQCAPNAFPGTCTGTTLTPMSSGTPFSLTLTPVNAPAVDYSFAIEGTGTDPNNTSAQTAPVTLSISDYSFVVPSPTNLTVNQGATSAAVNLPLTAFYQPITLSCSNLPVGATCNFFPYATVPPSNFDNIILTVSAGPNTPLGTSTITVSANSPGQPSAKSGPVSLSVTNSPDYSMLTSQPAPAIAGSAATAQITLTPSQGYSGPVTLSCSVAVGITCSMSPPSPITLAGAPVTVTATISTPLTNGATIGGYFEVPFTATAPGTVTHSTAVHVTVTDFALGARTNSATVLAGQPGQYELNVIPGVAPFTNPISFSCSGLPPGTACSFSPATVTPGSSPAIVVLSISTPKSLAELHPAAPLSEDLLLFSMLLPGMVLSLSGGIRSRRSPFTLLLIVVLATLLFQPACGGGGSAGPPTPPTPTPAPAPQPFSTTYPVVLTASSGTVQHQVNLNLVVWQQ